MVRTRLFGIVLGAGVALACSRDQPPAPPAAEATVTLLAAGDIASCDSLGDEATARLLAERPGTFVAALGDTVYETGTDAEYAQCYEPTWGPFKRSTRPTPGNHEYGDSRARGYFGYFGESAGPPGKGYYSYDIGSWHVVVLNSNCTRIRCDLGSEQVAWLRADLAANPTLCTLAYWHHPRFSSGREHGSDPSVGDLYATLYQHGADVVLAAHEHHYERFAPLDPQGRPDPASGIRSFVVGTGGKSHYPFGDIVPGSEVRNAEVYGVLELTLRTSSYEWRFLAAEGGSFEDAGTERCHFPPSGG
jgi:hypothetical protein